MLKFAAVLGALLVQAALVVSTVATAQETAVEPVAAEAAAPSEEAVAATSDAVPVEANEAAAGDGGAVQWDRWSADNEITNIGSLQRGARNFVAYCSACHSLKYSRYSRVGEDLSIPEDQLDDFIVLPGDKKTDYMLTTLSAADGEAWFGKAPPDLSLIARSKGTDYVFQFLKTYYADPNTATGVNNLALPGTAMPHVLSDLQGVPTGAFRQTTVPASGGVPESSKVEFIRFDGGTPGRLGAAEYDEFVRDIVNFLDYVGEPAKAKRISVGIWVVLFLLVFSGIAYLLKLEYWKDVK